MGDQPDVRVAQVWEQRSGDLKGRRHKVLELTPNGVYARVELVRNSTDVQDALDGNPRPEWKRIGYKPTDVRGQKTHIQVKVLRPPRFVLVEDVPAEASRA